MKKINVLIVFLTMLFVIGALIGESDASMFSGSVDRLVSRSDVVVHGVVTGYRAVISSNGRDIRTVITIRTLESIKGYAPADFSFTIPGGLVGTQGMFVTDYPDFEIGQEVVLLMDSTLEQITGRIQGKFTIQNGLVRELMLDASDFITALHSIVAGQEPSLDLNRTFAPISVEQGMLRRLNAGQKYDYNGLKWSGHSINIYINENCNETSGEGNAVKSAMQSWNNAPANFSFNYAGTHGSTSSSGNYKNEVLWSWSKEKDTIAYAQCWTDYVYLVECDLVFLYSGDYSWSTVSNPSYSQMDVQNIAAHEFGHFLQLLDLYNGSDSEKTMYGYSDSGETKKRSLHQDDKNGIIHIYGSGTGDDDDDDDDDDNDDDNNDDDDDDDSSSDDDDDSGDDDSGDDDDTGSDDDDNGTDQCLQFVELLFDYCDFHFVVEGTTMGKQETYDLCVSGTGPWDCLLICSNHQEVQDCTDFSGCIANTCGITVGTDESDEDEEENSGTCG